MNKICIRCGSERDPEGDHIIPKVKGGTDDPANKRILCEPCHKFRHAKDKILSSIENELRRLGTGQFNSARFTMLIMRLGVLEVFNTPEKIKERGSYMSYWKVPTTHYSRWYPQIKLEGLNKLREKELTRTLEDFK